MNVENKQTFLTYPTNDYSNFFKSVNIYVHVLEILET